METCRNAFAKPGVRENVRAEAAQSGSVSMAEVRLVNVKKIYPFVSGEEKKKKKTDKSTTRNASSKSTGIQKSKVITAKSSTLSRVTPSKRVQKKRTTKRTKTF